MDTDVYAKIHAVEDGLWFYLGRREIVRRLLESFGGLAGKRYLDVGCGGGGALQFLGGDSAISVGLDVAAEALCYSRNRGLACLFQGNAEGLALAPAAFEIVTALDVLEHCGDDLAALREIYRVLAPGGLCCLTCPALMILWSNLDRVNRHFRRYTIGELRAKAEQAGFEVLRATYANTWLFPGILGIRLIQRLTQRPEDGAGALDFAMPNATLNALLARIFTSEAAILEHGSLPIGSSAVTVLRKPGGAA